MSEDHMSDFSAYLSLAAREVQDAAKCPVEVMRVLLRSPDPNIAKDAINDFISRVTKTLTLAIQTKIHLGLAAEAFEIEKREAER